MCDLAFSKKENLKKHIREIHVRDKSFRCNICDVMFSRKQDLNQHIAKDHEGKKQNLRNRINAVQEGTKDKKCAIDKKSSLTMHIKSDHDEKRSLKCDLCKVSFLTNRGFKHHALWYCKESSKNP